MIFHSTQTTVGMKTPWNGRDQAKIQISSNLFVPLAQQKKLDCIVVLFEKGEMVDIPKVKSFIEANTHTQEDPDQGIPFVYTCVLCHRTMGTTKAYPTCCGIQMQRSP